jgi:tRNA threonylcarbamoyl adenosine modification protein (Sua5/YciO/YrdC/YwlC family)
MRLVAAQATQRRALTAQAASQGRVVGAPQAVRRTGRHGVAARLTEAANSPLDTAVTASSVTGSANDADMDTEVLSVSETELRQAGEASTSGRQEWPAAVSRAAAVLRSGQVVAMPTETVYGLAANALDAAAVARIFAAKNRPADNPLIVHVSSLAMLASLYPDGRPLPAIYEPLVTDLWPGPLTILLPASPLLPASVTAGQPTMAVRVPAHPLALALIDACGFPLAAPSANSSGRPSPTLAHHVLADLGGRVPLILDGGPCSCGLESTVLDALRSPPALLRPGGVTAEQLRLYPGFQGLQVRRRGGRADPTSSQPPRYPPADPSPNPPQPPAPHAPLPPHVSHCC